MPLDTAWPRRTTRARLAPLLKVLALAGMLAALQASPHEAHAAPPEPPQGPERPADAANPPAQQIHEDGTRDLRPDRQPDALRQLEKPTQSTNGSGILDGIRLTDWLLAVVSVLQTILIGWQAGIARGQKGIMAMQAELAAEQAGIAIRQADTADRQLAFTREVNRPAVFLNSIHRQLGEAWTNANIPAIEVVIANYGRSPAIIDRVQIGLVVGEGFPERRGTPEGEKGMSTVWEIPGGPRHVEMYTSFFRAAPMQPDAPWHLPSKRVSAPAFAASILSGQVKFWVDGVAFYREISGTTHETWFRYVFDSEGELFIPDYTDPQANRVT